MKLSAFSKRIFFNENLILLLIVPLFMLGFKVAIIAYKIPISIAPVWPPTGLGIAAVLIYEKRAFAPLAAGILLSHLLIFPIPLGFIPFSFVVNAIIPVMALSLRNGVLKSVNVLEESTLSLMKLLLIGLIISGLGGIIGVTGLCLNHLEKWENFFNSLLVWTLGNSFGVFVCAPALLRVFLLLRKHFQIRVKIRTYMDVERTFWICLILAGFTILPYTSYWNSQYLMAMGFILLSMLTWSALRFQPVFTNIAVMVTVLSIWTLIGYKTPGFPYPETLPEAVSLLLYIGMIAFFPIFISITTHQGRLLQKRLAHQANHDSLTGILNRRGFEQEVVAFLEKSNGPISAGMVFMNIDRLKIINDSCGHLAGDHLLEQIAFFLQSQFTTNAFISRFSGDTFSLFIYQIEEGMLRNEMEILRKKIQDYRYIWEGETYAISVSIGIVYLITPRSLSILLAKADMTCHLSKESGGNQITFLNVEDQTLDQKRRRWSIFSRLGKALESNSFILFAQPILPLQKKNAPKHYEILLRMHDEDGAIMLPNEFLPVAEQNHLMRNLDFWVVDHTLKFLEAHPQILKRKNLFCINLSGQSINSTSFQDNLIKRVSSSTVPGSLLCFEITESATIQNLKMAKRFLDNIKSFNCSFALDDFGKGFSSFSYIKNLPIDYIKIDGSFIRDSFDSEVDQAMIKAVAEIAASLGLKTIAEYVCSDEINELVTYLKIDYGQGSFLGNPDYLEKILHLN